MRVRSSEAHIARLVLSGARAALAGNLRRIADCLRLLTEEEIWWRPNAASNSAGNLVLHLSGNVRQWIISGLGGAPDVRIRDREFSERGPLGRRLLLARLRKTVREACRVLRRLSPEALAREYKIQGFRVTGCGAISDVVAHFSHHTGQIIYVTKLKRGRGLRFTKLPRIPKRNRDGKKA
ncbi:MAG TPA: DUF1572 family protein [Candidatus Acidoferrales bacterium]|nr:DUF1572 family protein [Candidatus Acidoferrales bacterium]